jgi:glycosyltransferase involved in cell wall biosynthesis
LIKVTAITPGYNAPSSRFRIRQYIPKLRTYNILVDEYPSLVPYDSRLPFVKGRMRMRYYGPFAVLWQMAKLLGTAPGAFASWSSDVVWLNREMAGGYHIMERLLKNPIYFDVDDAVWLNNPKTYKIAERSEGIIAGNSFIADWFSKYNKNIFVVPTAVDTDRFCPNPGVRKDEKFIIGWTGSADGLRYVYEIEEHLNSFLKKHENTFIKVICDKKPVFKFIVPERTIYIPWNPILENKELQDVSVGIMPLPDNEWSRGKCSFKMLQYMSMAIPVIVSEVGMNSEVLAKSEVGFGVKKPEEWQDAMEALRSDQTLQRKMGGNGRALVEKEYSVVEAALKLSEIFKNYDTNIK